MSDAEIKAALDAARMGICRTLDINPGEPPCKVPCLLCREGSAAAVAAFLRALPDGDICTQGIFTRKWHDGKAMTLHNIAAAAVERAAKEDNR